MEPLHVHVNVDHGLLAQRAHRMVLQVQRVLVPLHVALARENFVTNVTRKLTALALVNLGDVNAQIFGVAEIFVAHTALKFCRQLLLLRLLVKLV